MIETRLDNLKQLFELKRGFLTAFIFRGQSEFKWELRSSIERIIQKYSNEISPFNDFEFFEKWMLHDFIRKYPLYSNTYPSKSDLFEWLAIMQHHGAPTRLLDFTESLFIGIYFAVIDAQKDSALWCINRNKLRRKLASKHHFPYDYENALKDEINLAHIDYANTFIADQNVLLTDNRTKTVIPLEPKLCNERISRQQALFLMPTSSSSSFQDNLFEAFDETHSIKKVSFRELINQSNKDGYLHAHILKIKLPKSIHSELLEALCEMNITADTLFPGIDGLAKSLIQTHIRK